MNLNNLKPMKTFKSAIFSMLTFTVFFAFICGNSFAQLSGTKVIGTAPSDYTTFTAAVSALTSQGISASVIFEVKAGTYNEQITIGNITGVTATKTITFQSQNLDSTSVTLSYASSNSGTNNYVLFLDNADYICFSHMTIQRTGTNNYAQVIDISNGATHNTFQNCILKGTTAASITTFTVIVGSTSTLEDSYNSFTGNIFMNGSYGLYFLGRGSTMLDPGLVVSNNIFQDQNYKGIYITCQDSPVITGNYITTNSSNNSFNGIYGQYANNETSIVKNKLQLSIGTGISLANCEGTGGNVMLIANNFISVAGSSTNYGLYLNQVKYTNVYYNSINLTTSSAGRALYMGGVTTQNNDFLNNIFANHGGGYAVYVDPNTTTPFQSCNYNDLYTSGTNLGYWKSSGDQANLTNWQTASGLDANSLTADPGYVSTTDLHAQSGAINCMGTPNLSSLTPISDDIDGQTRNVLTPDIGADEFYIEDVGVSSLSLDSAYCQYSSATIKIIIRNYSAYPFQGIIPVYYQVSGGSVVNVNTGNLYIAGSDSTMYFFSTLAYFDVAGYIPIIAGTNLSIDIDQSNDDYLSGSINVLLTPDADAGDDVYVCMGDSAILTVTGGTSFSWNTSPIETTATIHVLVNDTTEFIATVSNTNGCSSTDTVVVIPGIFPKPTADFTYTPAGMQYTFTDNSLDATSWDWNFGDGLHSTLQNPVHLYGSNGNYNVTLIAMNGCLSDTTIKGITVYGIREIDLSADILLSPNPANDYFTLFIPENVTIKQITVSELTGKIIWSYDGNLQGKVDLFSFSSGYYIVYILTDKGFARKKLLIQR
jgi:PKD repeat protein